MINFKKKIICFDLDNVICHTKGNDYKKSKPNKLAIKKINQLYRNGHKIKIFTARYMGRSKENSSKAKTKGYKITHNQLKKWNLKFHYLIMGKPSYDLIVDDLSIYFKSTWYKDIDKYIK